MNIKANISEVHLRWHACPKTFCLPNVSVGVGVTIGEEEEAGWQTILAISLQQSSQKWQYWSQ